MAETLGSLCDKLTIVKLKQWHTLDDAGRLESLARQAQQLQSEIDGLIAGAVSGAIPPDRLTFAANKVYKKEGNAFAPITGDWGETFARLATTNCELWHEQEKVYEFEKVAAADKDAVVKQLAILNLQRNACIDRIDRLFREAIEKNPVRSTT